jgi:lysophospholipase L1-like esterase
MKAFLIAAGTTGVFLLIAGAFLWYSHASIYWKLGKLPLPSSLTEESYLIGSAAASSSITYVALGDSLTAGVGVDAYTSSYPYLLAKDIAKGGAAVTLDPYAVPGVRSQYVIDNFLEKAIARDPDIVTLFIGINDIHGNVPASVFRKHYATILEALSQKTDAKIYAINLPYIGTSGLINAPMRYYFAWRIATYNEIIKELAAEYGATYVDLYAAQLPHELDPSYYAADAFHPNALGYTVWSQRIYESLHQ